MRDSRKTEKTQRSDRKSTRSRKTSEYEPCQPEIRAVHPKTYAQEEMLESIGSKPITIANAPAGCGKTLIALYAGVRLLERGQIDQILYCKPVVEFKGERGIGFLPGDVKEKIDPLLYPVKDNLQKFVSSGKMQYLLDKEKIKFELLEYVRGRSLGKKYVILDEAQNCYPHAVLTILSRLEQSSKAVILGDAMQCDNEHLKNNGLTDGIKRLQGLPEVGIVNFDKRDIVRSSFLASVISRYE